MSILRLALWRAERFQSLLAMAQRGASAGLVLTLLWVAAGWASPPPPGPPVETDAAAYEGGKIYIGDTVRVVFPGSQTLNFSQVVRVDGKLDLGLQGELKVEGKTAQEVEDELLKLYGE